MNIGGRERALLGLVAALAVIGAFYVLVLAPQHRRADQLQRQIATARTTLSTAQLAYASGRHAEQTLIGTEGEYAAAQRAVPSISDVPTLLRMLQRTADAAHVKIDSISLSGSGSGSAAAATPAPTAVPAAGATAGSAAGSSDVATPTPIPISLTFGGGYQALNRLVQRLNGEVSVHDGRLASAGPLIGISIVTLNQAPTTSGGASRLNVSLTATIYQTGSTASVLGNAAGS